MTQNHNRLGLLSQSPLEEGLNKNQKVSWLRRQQSENVCDIEKLFFWKQV